MTIHYFTVETKIFIDLHFNLDFTGSEDIVIENSEDLQIEYIVPNNSAETVAIVKEFPHSRLNW